MAKRIAFGIRTDEPLTLIRSDDYGDGANIDSGHATIHRARRARRSCRTDSCHNSSSGHGNGASGGDGANAGARTMGKRTRQVQELPQPEQREPVSSSLFFSRTINLRKRNM